jgi:glycosyltransferase involved in cell wall biosynthesis
MWVVIPGLDLFYINLLQLIGKKVVLTAHNPFPHEFKQKHIDQYSRIYKQVDGIIVLTAYSRGSILDNVSIDESKIDVIPHGDFNYVLSHFSINNNLADKVKQKAGNRWIISYFGHMREYKGVEYFIKAIPLIRKLNSSTFFIIAGNPRFANEEKLRDLIAEHCDDEFTLTDLRFVPTADMKTYFSLTNVLVQPYISASQSGNTVMAYSYGIPVISTNVGGLAEMTRDGFTGYVVPPKNEEAIAKAVCKCLKDDNYNKLKENCRLSANNEYSWNKIAEDHLTLYEKLEMTGN